MSCCNTPVQYIYTYVLTCVHEVCIAYTVHWSHNSDSLPLTPPNGTYARVRIAIAMYFHAHTVTTNPYSPPLPSPPLPPLPSPPLPSSVGIIGGKFLERGRIAKAKRDRDEPSVYHTAEDFYVGGHVVLNNHKFILIDADEYALKYMEKHDQVRILYTCHAMHCTQLSLSKHMYMLV